MHLSGAVRYWDRGMCSQIYLLPQIQKLDKFFSDLKSGAALAGVRTPDPPASNRTTYKRRA